MDGHSEAQRTCAAESSEPVFTLFPVWEKQVFWERIFPGIGKRGEKVVKSREKGSKGAFREGPSKHMSSVTAKNSIKPPGAGII